MGPTKLTAATLAVAAALALTPAAALAQDNAAVDNGTTDTTYTERATVEEDDNDFPWGLLGLLGLAGLLGRKRQERDIHVDARKH
jgi:MYXO-CTERM domain-containing protein